MLKKRASVIAWGIFFALFGIWTEWHGVLAWANWRWQPVFSAGVIAFGGLIIALASLPSSWVAKLAAVHKPKPTYLHRRSQHLRK